MDNQRFSLGIFLLFLFLPACLQARNNQFYAAEKVGKSTEIVLDGRLDKPVWKQGK